MSDEELFAADFPALVNRYRGCIAAYTGSDDLEHLAFVFVYCHRAKFRPGQLFRPWLYEVAYRLALKHRKRQRRERRQLAEYAAST